MKSLFVLLQCLLLGVLADEESQFTQKIEDGFQHAKEQYSITDQTNLTSWDVQPVGLDFPCDLFPRHPNLATNVNEVTPYDIDVVGALGDSLTAGQGAAATTIFTATKQYRGYSFSAGGDKDLSSVTTLPNILRMYNPTLKGYSTGTGKESAPNSKENCAISGATSESILSQAKSLVERIKTDPDNIDNEQDWKIISIFIGSNDLCSFCKNEDRYSADNYLKNIAQGLDYLYENLPRAIVNLVLPIDVTRLEPVSGLLCDIIHWYACDCISGKDKDKTSQASTTYQERLGELLEEDRYEKDDFTVVVQPFFIGVELPYKDGKPDKSYFAPDCFHFSTKSQAETAKALWNNMLEPVGSKNNGWQIGESIKCPTAETPYFYTRKNSNLNDALMNGNPQNNHADNTDGETDSRNLVAVIAASSVGAVMLVVLVVAVTLVVGIALKRKRRQLGMERIPLVIKTQH